MRPRQRYYYRLMSNSMTGFVDPLKMAKMGQSLHGVIKVAAMPRVIKLLASNEGEVAYSLEFSNDEDGRCFIVGSISGGLSMNCQRCLATFVHEIECSFTVSPVLNDEEARVLTKEYDPVIVVDAKLALDELIEDELILALPIVVMHDQNHPNCKELVTTKEQELTNPFQILQELKLKKNGQQAEDKNGSTTKS